MSYKCFTCHLVLSPKDVVDKKCPICKEEFLVEMCKADHPCKCATQTTPGLQYCSLCGDPICPCGSHDVATISRVTGYLQVVEGWNAAKRQELKDRVRYDI